MSMEAYSIAVKISLVENVTRGLMMMSRHFATTDAQAKALETRLKSIAKLTMVGGALAGAGAYGLSLFKKPIDDAMEYERRLGSLRQMGLGDAQIADAKKFVQATSIIGESMNDRMRLFVDAQGSFRQSGMDSMKALEAAKTMMPILGTYEAASKMLSGEHRSNAEMAMRSLNKTIEIMGGLSDTERAKAIADGVFKAAQSSGRMVDERQLKQFVAYGGSATNQLNFRTVFGGLEPLIGEFGGSTSANGLLTAFNRVNGTMSLPPKRLIAEMARLNMLKAGTKQETDSLANLQVTDVISYAREMMRRYAAAGITSRTEIERENSILFGRTGSKIYNKIMSQMPVIEESLRAYDRAKGASGVLNDPQNQALKAQIDLEAKERDLKLQIGKTVLPLYVKGLEMTRDVLQGIVNFSTQHPTAFKGLVIGFAALSAVAVVGGSVMLVAGGLSAMSLVFPVLAGSIGGVSAAATAASGAAGIGSLLSVLTGPLGLTLAAGAAAAAIGALVYSLWKHSDDQKAKARSGEDIGVGRAGSAYALHWVQDSWGRGGNFGHWEGKGSGVMNSVRTGADGGHYTTPLKGMKINPEYKSPYIAPPSQTPVMVQGGVYIDGKAAGKILTPTISNEQAKAASRPNTGGTTFDGSRGMPSVGVVR